MGGVADSRTGVPLQKGNLWVVWETTSNKTAFYLSVDSTVGVRAMYAAPRTTLWLDPGIASKVSDGLLGSNTSCGGTSTGLGVGITEDCTLPSAAVSAITGQQFTVGFSELRPEDAKMATVRTCSFVGGCPAGIGAGVIGSSLSTSSVRPIDFNISGTDPISGAAVPTYTTLPVGANSVIVFVNDQAGSQGLGGLGHRTSGVPDVQDIIRPQLAGFVNGSWSLTRDVNMDGSLAAVPVTTFVREPLSGTYNTFEFSVPNVAGLQQSQEDGTWINTPGTASGSTLGTGARKRAIGTGEMTGSTGVGGVSNSLGYSFWGFGNFASASTKCRYLTVDGVEPLQNASNYGFFPFGWNFVSHKALKQGDYPIWGLYYAMVSNPNDPFFVWMRQVADFVVGNYPEYVAWSNMKVFKSHYNPDNIIDVAVPPMFPGMAAHNGIAAGAPTEWGGTVAGQTYGKNTESDYFINSGGQELTERLR
jgi:hypothetical protein